jgi:cation diffusion facilitator family transporter
MDGQVNLDSEETRQVQRVGLYSFLVNLGLAGLKASLAYFSGSLAIIASAVDSTTDAVASLAVWGGLKLSTRKSRRFPYGLYKIENVIQVVIALLILFSGIEIARKALSPAGKPPAITPWVIGGMLLGVIIPLVFGWYTISVGKRTGSPALVADGRHRQVDVLSSAVVLGAVISGYFGLPLDRIAAALVLVFIGYAGWELLVDGMRVLLDASIDSETLAQVREIVESEPRVTEIRSLVGRSAGRYRFLEVDLSLRTDDLEKAHSLSKRIESSIRKHVSHVDRVLIHYEPQSKETQVVAVPLESDRESLSEHFGEAPLYYLGVVKVSNGQILEERFVPNPLLGEEKGKGIKISEWLLQQGTDVVYSPKSLEGKGPGYVFSDGGVEVRVLQGETLSGIREAWSRPASDRGCERGS